jgi:DNA-binding NarL/FixJ family response regulator
MTTRVKMKSSGMTPGAKKQKRGVYLVDDHPLVREWLANLINRQPDLKVCGQASSSAQALKLMAAARPEIAIVDISMEGVSGMELIKEIKTAHPEVVVLALSMHDELLYAEKALRAGAAGYVMKREATKKVLEAIRCVLGGKRYLSEKLASQMAEKFVTGKPPAMTLPEDRLSGRELEVFELLGRGRTTRQTAENLNVSFKTVQTFHARIKEKLNLANSTELLREATLWYEGRRRD